MIPHPRKKSEMGDEPFMPIANISDDHKIETTWGVLQNYRRQIAERDAKIADLIMERDALLRKINP